MPIKEDKNTIVYKTLGSNEILKYFSFIKRNKEYIKKYEEIIRKKNASYSKNSAYMGLLKKANIINNQRENIDFLKIEDKSSFCQSIFVRANDCFPIYYLTSEIPNKDRLGLSVCSEIPKEYCLIVNGEGELSLASYFDKKASIIDFYSKYYYFFINTPLLLYSLISNKKYEKERLIMEEIANKNPFCTLANVYNYIKNNGEQIRGLPQKIREIETSIKKINDMEKENISTHNFMTFSVSTDFRYEAEKHLPSYYIDNENNKVSLKVKYIKEEIFAYNYRNYEESFPAYIEINGNKFKPYFLQNKFYTDEKLVKKVKEKLYSPKHNEGFLTLSEKIEELSLIGRQKIENEENWHDSAFEEYLPPLLSKENKNMERSKNKETMEFRKKVTELLKNNTNFVLNVLEKHISSTTREEIFGKQEKYLTRLDAEVSNFTKLSDDMTVLFRNIYKNEILLKNL